MTVTFTNWSDFLELWDQDVLDILLPLQDFYPTEFTPLEQKFLQRKTLSQPKANTQQIQALEDRLGVKLPPSYLKFLQTSNGWIQLGMDADDGILWSTEQVKWFIEQDPEWIEMWETGEEEEVHDHLYFIYGNRQDCIHLRRKYLRTALAISNCIDSAVYLLNPQIITPQGEWEAWFLGNKLPGAIRYRSFQEMMIAEKERVLYNLKEASEYFLYNQNHEFT
jgi:hypothetical protein